MVAEKQVGAAAVSPLSPPGEAGEIFTDSCQDLCSVYTVEGVFKVELDEALHRAEDIKHGDAVFGGSARLVKLYLN